MFERAVRPGTGRVTDGWATSTPLLAGCDRAHGEGEHRMRTARAEKPAESGVHVPEKAPAKQSRRLVVVGQGYVGLPLSMLAVQAGYDVIGFDLDEVRVKRLTVAESYVEDVS